MGRKSTMLIPKKMASTSRTNSFAVNLDDEKSKKKEEKKMKRRQKFMA